MIKWPNDLWVRGAKIGGILCEGIGNKNDSFIVIGLGLNCERVPEVLDQAVTSLLAEVSGHLAKAAEVDGVREAIVQAIPMVLDELYLSGPALIVERFNRWSALPPGTQIEWSSGAPGGAVNTGMVIGLGTSGELAVKTSDGENRKLYAEDVKVRAVPKAGGESPA
jgi:BirA family biotin operon repressor/biotin-[acetyl-CoA-carboxylase] ligase